MSERELLENIPTSVKVFLLTLPWSQRLPKPLLPNEEICGSVNKEILALHDGTT
jgi:hypothetical protein